MAAPHADAPCGPNNTDPSPITLILIVILVVMIVIMINRIRV